MQEQYTPSGGKDATSRGPLGGQLRPGLGALPPYSNTGATVPVSDKNIPTVPLPPLGAPVITMVPACDWITLTTYSIGAYVQATHCIGVIADGQPVRAKMMQYEGWQGQHYFYGEALQQGRKHYYVRASGAFADTVLQLAYCEGWLAECTSSRIDLQITSPLPDGLSLPGVAEYLRSCTSAMWYGGKGGNRPRIDYRSNDDGLDTVYTGSRASRRMHRYYVKPIEQERMLRMEVEYKDDLAKRVHSEVVQTGPIAIRSMLKGELEATPIFRLDAFARIQQLVGDAAQKPIRKREKPDIQASLDWLFNAVLPAGVRMAEAGCREQLEEFHRQFGEMLAMHK